MNLLLILREEIVCLVSLLYLLTYSFRFVREDNFYLRLNLFGVGHVIFDMITIYTVNHLDTVPEWVNRGCHVIFYAFAILFCCELFRYVLKVTHVAPAQRHLERLVYLIPALFVLLTPFLRIDYLSGNGSHYSFGPCVFVGYALAVLIFFASEALLLTHLRELAPGVKRALIPGFAFMSIAVILQVFLPELLFTGADITLVTFGVFFALVNPAEKYRQKAYVDSVLGVLNRNAYNDEMERLNREGNENLRERRFSVVVFDMNGLKQVNDRFGHPVGDTYLKAAARILKQELRHAHGIYRAGGDEFCILYLDTELAQITRELEQVERCCDAWESGYDMPLSVAWGCAVMGEGQDTHSVVRNADKNMFTQKRHYYEDSLHDRRNNR